LPHRLAFVAERRGVRYYNDSKSTTPASAHLALESFHEPVILLLGGGDKGLSFDPLVQAASAQAKAVVCYGQTGPLLHERFHSISRESPSKCRLVSAGNLEKAIEAADELSAPGDVVLLSPACTSYDAFANYEQRGARFIELVRSLPE
jgi:UDP-N-acetylmuramoylalanine--D-glutamate ligase